MVRNRYPTKQQIKLFLQHNNLFALEQIINEAMNETGRNQKIIIEETGHNPIYEKVDGYIVRKIK